MDIKFNILKNLIDTSSNAIGGFKETVLEIIKKILEIMLKKKLFEIIRIKYNIINNIKTKKTRC